MSSKDFLQSAKPGSMQFLPKVDSVDQGIGSMMVKIHEGVYVDAARVVSVEVKNATMVRVTWSLDIGKSDHVDILPGFDPVKGKLYDKIPIIDRIKAARKLADEIMTLVNRGRFMVTQTWEYRPSASAPSSVANAAQTRPMPCSACGNLMQPFTQIELHTVRNQKPGPVCSRHCAQSMIEKIIAEDDARIAAERIADKPHFVFENEGR